MKSTNANLKILGVFFLSMPCLLNFSCATKPKSEGHISDVSKVLKKRNEMYDAIVREIDRIDADRNDVLRLKGENWVENVSDIRSEVNKAKSLEELGRALKKIDGTYPHAQSQQVLNPDLESVALGSKVVLPFKLTPTIVEKNQEHFKFFISQVSPDDFEPGAAPHVGDEVVEINKKPMSDWEEENYRSCKSVSRLVCALDFNHNFRNENLSWNHHSEVELKLIRAGGQKLVAKLKPKVEVSGGFEASESSDVYNDVFPCGVDIKRRYFEFGFLYKGRRLCALGSHAYPGTVVMRISNFNYTGGEDSIHSVKQEVELFKASYWNEHGAEIKHLIIDVIDNDGGEAPVAYEQLLFDRPFQDQYIKYKKLKEWANEPIEDNFFSTEGDGGKSIWLKSLKEEGAYDKVSEGDFFDPIPRYCVSPKLDCRKGRFEPEETHFKGDVRVMLNQNCMLACSSFVSDLAEHLGGRIWFYGLPDSGDPLASQIALNVYLSKDSEKTFEIRTQVWNSAAPSVSQDLLFTQTIAFSQTTDAAGNVISGQSRKIRKMPILNYKNFPMNYPGEILKTILKDLK